MKYTSFSFKKLLFSAILLACLAGFAQSAALTALAINVSNSSAAVTPAVFNLSFSTASAGNITNFSVEFNASGTFDISGSVISNLTTIFGLDGNFTRVTAGQRIWINFTPPASGNAGCANATGCLAAVTFINLSVTNIILPRGVGNYTINVTAWDNVSRPIDTNNLYFVVQGGNGTVANGGANSSAANVPTSIVLNFTPVASGNMTNFTFTFPPAFNVAGANATNTSPILGLTPNYTVSVSGQVVNLSFASASLNGAGCVNSTGCVPNQVVSVNISNIITPLGVGAYTIGAAAIDNMTKNVSSGATLTFIVQGGNGTLANGGANSSGAVTPASIVLNFTPATTGNMTNFTFTFPVGFNVAGANATNTSPILGLTPNYTVSVSGQVVNLSFASASLNGAGCVNATGCVPNQVVSVNVSNIILPRGVGVYTIGVAAIDNLTANVSTGSLAFIVQGGNGTLASGGANSSGAVTPVSIVLNFTPVASGNMTNFTFTFPPAFNVAGANATNTSPILGLTPNYTVSVSGQVVNLSFASASLSGAGCVNSTGCVPNQVISVNVSNIILPRGVGVYTIGAAAIDNLTANVSSGATVTFIVEGGNGTLANGGANSSAANKPTSIVLNFTPVASGNMTNFTFTFPPAFNVAGANATNTSPILGLSPNYTVSVSGQIVNISFASASLNGAGCVNSTGCVPNQVISINVSNIITPLGVGAYTIGAAAIDNMTKNVSSGATLTFIVQGGNGTLANGGANSSAANKPTSIVLNFTPATTGNMTNFTFTFPVGFNVAGANATNTSPILGLTPNYTVSVSGQVVNLSFASASLNGAGCVNATGCVPNQVISVNVSNIITPLGVGVYTIGVAAIDNLTANVSTGGSIAFIVEGGNGTVANGGANTSAASAPGYLVLNFTPVAAGNITNFTFTFPPSFNVGKANATNTSPILGLTPNYTVSVSGQIVNISFASASLNGAGCVNSTGCVPNQVISVNVSNIILPSSVGVYTIGAAAFDNMTKNVSSGATLAFIVQGGNGTLTSISANSSAAAKPGWMLLNFTPGVSGNMTNFTLTFPVGFNVAGANVTNQTPIAGLTPNYTVSVSGQVVNLSFASASLNGANCVAAAGCVANQVISVNVSNIILPTGVGVYTIGVAAIDNLTANVSTGGSVTLVVEGGNSTVLISSANSSASGKPASIAFSTTANAAGNMTNFTFTFPPAFTVSGANATNNSPILGLTPNYTVSVSGQIVNLSFASASLNGAGCVNSTGCVPNATYIFNLSNIILPTAVGAYTIGYAAIDNNTKNVSAGSVTFIVQGGNMSSYALNSSNNTGAFNTTHFVFNYTTVSSGNMTNYTVTFPGSWDVSKANVTNQTPINGVTSNYTVGVSGQVVWINFTPNAAAGCANVTGCVTPQVISLNVSNVLLARVPGNYTITAASFDNVSKQIDSGATYYYTINTGNATAVIVSNNDSRAGNRVNFTVNVTVSTPANITNFTVLFPTNFSVSGANITNVTPIAGVNNIPFRTVSGQVLNVSFGATSGLTQGQVISLNISDVQVGLLATTYWLNFSFIDNLTNVIDTANVSFVVTANNKFNITIGQTFPTYSNSSVKQAVNGSYNVTASGQDTYGNSNNTGGFNFGLSNTTVVTYVTGNGSLGGELNTSFTGTATVTIFDALNSSVTNSTTVNTTRHPGVTNVTIVNVTVSGATINFTTDDAGNTWIEYGRLTTFGQGLNTSFKDNSTRVVNHQVTISGEGTSTLFYYRVWTCSNFYLCSASSQFNFSTSAATATTTGGSSGSAAPASSGGGGAASSTPAPTAAPTAAPQASATPAPTPVPEVVVIESNVLAVESVEATGTGTAVSLAVSDLVSAGSTATIALSPSSSASTGVAGISITAASDVSGLNVVVEKLDAAPEGAPKASASVLSYLDISTNADSSAIEKAKITFSVPASKAKSGQVVLLHLQDKWVELKTKQIGSDADGNLLFEATTDGFSPFAIAVKATPRPRPTVRPTVAPTTAPKAAGPTPASPLGTYVGWIVAIVVLFAVGYGIGMYLKKRK